MRYRLTVPRRQGASPYKLLRSGNPEWGPGLEYIYVSVFLGSIINSRLCKLILSYQTQDAVLLRVSLSGLV